MSDHIESSIDYFVTLNRSLSLRLSFLRTICNLFTFPNTPILSFRLTRKSYPTFCEISTQGCVIQNPAADIPKSG